MNMKVLGRLRTHSSLQIRGSIFFSLSFHEFPSNCTRIFALGHVRRAEICDSLKCDLNKA